MHSQVNRHLRCAVAFIAALLCLEHPRAAPSTPIEVKVAAEARSFRPGELAALTISVPEDTERVRVEVFKKEFVAFKTAPTTWRALVGIDLETRPGDYGVVVDTLAGSASSRTTYHLVISPRQFPVRRLKVDPAFVNPPASAVARIRDDQASMERVFSHSAPDRLWSGPFIRPVPESSPGNFGSRSIFNGVARSPHSGADFPSPQGTPIKAPNQGRVVLARDLYFSGNTVIIDHGLGMFSLLAHLSVVAVHENEEVTAGEIVGKVGATGRVTGPHLHWAVRVGDARVDPMSLLAILGPTVTGNQVRQLR
jgi:murein DD-endopeptidase MepM/ murein hydrolase activator NlpD